MNGLAEECFVSLSPDSECERWTSTSGFDQHGRPITAVGRVAYVRSGAKKVMPTDVPVVDLATQMFYEDRHKVVRDSLGFCSFFDVMAMPAGDLGRRAVSVALGFV
jgi:hypothetical protein